MSKWTDPEEWARRLSGEDCPICRSGGPHSVVTELESSWLTAGEEAPMQGYCALVFRRHAVELHDLTPEEGAAFMRDVQRVSAAVAAVVRPVKMNYEIHGNTIPHLHMHFFPRYPGDPFIGRPIDPPVRGSSEDLHRHLAIRHKLMERLLGEFR